MLGSLSGGLLLALVPAPAAALASPLHEAAAQGDFAWAEEILAPGREGERYLFEVDENGWLPIHEAVKTGDVDIARLLIHRGSQLDGRTSNGGTPLWWSRYLHGEDHEMTHFLRNMNAPDGDAAITSPSGGEQSEEAEAEPTQGTTELHFAATQGDVDAIARMLDEDPDLLHVTDVNGWQPLHEAVRSGSAEAVRLLVSRGADVHARTARGGTPLWWSRHLLGPEHPTVRFLEDIGAPDEGDAGELDY